MQAEGTPCFLCGETLGGSADQGYPIIFWMGPDTYVHWHAACAADFTFRIAQDVQKLKQELSVHLTFAPNDGVPGGS